MSQINIPFNGTDYPVDKSALSSATDALKTHLSTVMNGSGAVINLDGTSYNVDSTKLTNATNTFTSHLSTIGGSGSKVVINGVEYSLDSAKMNDAIADLHEIFNSIKTEVKEIAAGLYETGTNYGTMIASWDELVENGAVTITDGAITSVYLSAADTGSYITPPEDLPPVNEYGFYYDVVYSNLDWAGGIAFHADGSVDWYDCGELTYTNPAGTAIYGANSVDLSSIDYGTATFSDESHLIIMGDELSLGEIVFNTGDLVLPDDDSVTAIDHNAFQWCDILSNIVLGDSVTHIGYSAFYQCRNMRKIEIPASVTSIGSGAFWDCSSLTSITIPDSVTSIDSIAFKNCSSLTSITIPDSVIHIGTGAFANCTGLTEIEIPASATSVDGVVFENCTGLTKISFSDGVTAIGATMFTGCTGLTSIGPAGSGASVEIPASVTNIGLGAFNSCSSLTSITIPDGVTSIENSAFVDCTGLISVTIPDSVTSIGGWVFQGCESLVSVTVLAEAPPKIVDKKVFDDCPALTEIKVPASSVEAYKAADYWSEYAGIIVAI